MAIIPMTTLIDMDVDTEAEADPNLDLSMYPFLEKSLEDSGNLLLVEAEKKVIKIVGSSKLKEMNDKWEKFSVEETRMSEKLDRMMMMEKMQPPDKSATFISQERLDLFIEQSELWKKKCFLFEEDTKIFLQAVRSLSLNHAPPP